MSYVELHARSAFSFLRGGSRPEKLAAIAASNELAAVAVCDRDGVYGSPLFTRSAKEAGVRPIVGAEITLEDETVLPVLVASRRGYQNLCQLLTRAHLRAEKGKPRVRWEELPEFAEGLVALTGDEEGPLVGAMSGRVSKWVSETKANSHSPAYSLTHSPTQVLEKLTRMFGRENVFIEIQRHRLRGEERLNNALIDLARSENLPLLATNGVLYAEPAGRQVQDVFTCLRHHTHLDAAGLLLAPNGERHLKTPRQMRALFHDLPEAIDNTLRLAERLEFSLENLGYEFPRYATPNGEPMEAFLKQVTYDGARLRYPNGIPAEVSQKLEIELKLINKLGFAGYFLIVWDIVRFCRANNIMAQGRGSAANSAVCYCLHITAVDAVKAKLLFERFLSEGRKSWPDIDIDLPSGDQRERVIQEVYRRYGKRGAAMTANVITYRGRSSAREIGKVLNIGLDVLDRFSAFFANGDFPHTMDLLSQMKESGLPTDHPRAAAFAALYQQIKGLPRHLGQHSGGMIICQDKLDSVMPLENASMPGRVVAQWDKDDCNHLGIIKVDLLGLGMMSVLQDTMALVSQRGGPSDIAQLPQEDPKTFEMIRAADTIGVFQIESRAQMATLPRMKPKCFYDIVIEVAIIRPGPIQGNLTHPYLKRRASGEEPTYYDPKLKPVLEPILGRTLGIPLFQEQMLAMAMAMADFSGAAAEELRRALSFHRSGDLMEKVAKKLRTALVAKNYSEKVIEEVIAAIQSFALYGFPESHAISFAMLAYASAYLRAHYAPEFYASLLNNQPMGFYSSATLIKDAQRHGVKFRPVCVMRSEWDCLLESNADFQSAVSPAGSRQRVDHFDALELNDAPQVENLRYGRLEVCATTEAIRLGLRVVRGLSNASGQRLLAERAQATFTSLEDFKRRVRLSKEEARTLAEIGALNCFSAHRREAMWDVERAVREDLFAVAEEDHARFPLTPALSLRERENISPSYPRTPATNDLCDDPASRIETSGNCFDYSGRKELRNSLLPLPEGEGRGEGKGDAITSQPSKSSPLVPMDAIERLRADFTGTHLTVGKHPMALIRPQLKDVWRAVDLPKAKHGTYLRIAGNVICRQRPGTAKGFVFISLEDETGISNAIVRPDLFEELRLLITEESFLLIEGQLQNVDKVIHVRAEKIGRLQHEQLVGSESYDFH